MAQKETSPGQAGASLGSILFVSSGKMNRKFPQRYDHLAEALRRIGYRVDTVIAFNFIIGSLSVTRRCNFGTAFYSGYRAGMVGLFLSYLGIPMVYDCVENKAELCRDNWHGIKRVLIPIVECLEKMMFRRALLTFTAHPSAYNYARKYSPRTVLAENGYDEDLFDPNKFDREKLRQTCGVVGPLLLYTGKLIPMYAKYLSIAIAAMKEVQREFPDARLWIFGEGSSTSYLRELIDKMKVNAELKGYVEYQKTPELAAISDIGISAYRAESIKMMEWMRMGLPVIAPIPNYDRVIYSEWTREDLANTVTMVLSQNQRRYEKVLPWSDVARIISEGIKNLH